MPANRVLAAGTAAGEVMALAALAGLLMGEQRRGNLIERQALQARPDRSRTFGIQHREQRLRVQAKDRLRRIDDAAAEMSGQVRRRHPTCP